MKWDNPPLWPVALPCIIGFVLASSTLRTVKFSALSSISTPEGQDSLLTPLIVALILCQLLFLYPLENRRGDLVAGSMLGLLFGVLPEGIFYPWMILVFLIWIGQSLYIWKGNYPPFRIGFWIGLGASAGLFIGGFFGHYFL
ncbi:hypothetical protein OAI65_00600 [Candidatus Poseidoniales archaeon]|nr:hypothetical protein [Candidatus Poseidoniales archaeon]